MPTPAINHRSLPISSIWVHGLINHTPNRNFFFHDIDNFDFAVRLNVLATGSLLALTVVRVSHGLVGGQPGLMVIAQQLVQEVQGLGADQVLVLTVDEALPPLTRVSGRGEQVSSSAKKTQKNLCTAGSRCFLRQEQLKSLSN